MPIPLCFWACKIYGMGLTWIVLDGGCRGPTPRDHKQAEWAPRPRQSAVPMEHRTRAAHRRDNDVPAQKTQRKAQDRAPTAAEQRPKGTRGSSPPALPGSNRPSTSWMRDTGPCESKNHPAPRQRPDWYPRRQSRPCPILHDKTSCLFYFRVMTFSRSYWLSIKSSKLCHLVHINAYN